MPRFYRILFLVGVRYKADFVPLGRKGRIVTRLEAERRRLGLSKSKLARMADMNPATITWAEQRGFRLYGAQLTKLALALGWSGEPEALLQDVAPR